MQILIKEYIDLTPDRIICYKNSIIYPAIDISIVIIRKFLYNSRDDISWKPPLLKAYGYFHG